MWFLIFLNRGSASMGGKGYKQDREKRNVEGKSEL